MKLLIGIIYVTGIESEVTYDVSIDSSMRDNLVAFYE